MSNNNFTAVVMSDKIQVAIKVRPLVTREKEVGEFWRVNGNSLYPVNFDKQRSGEIFAYDHVFADNITNMEVFEKVVKPLVNRAVGGFNATIFAYGQTSSGKTHTMLGDQNEAGITQLAVSSMFDFMKKSGGREFLVRASYMEIYNDKVNDLLEQQNDNLKIREEDGKIVVQRLKEELVADSAEVMSLLKGGQEIRRIGETNLNERSSRSHTIFRLIIESRESDMGDVTQVSQLNFVDLAGSESAGLAGTTGERLKEGCAINQSLFQLSQVVAQLSEGSQFVNFRDSKLTRILQCSLGGNAHTLIICTVTPASVDFTLSTLRFASRAKAVKNKPQVNVVMPDGTQIKDARQLEKFQAELKSAAAKEQKRYAEMKKLKLDLQTERDERQFYEHKFEDMKKEKDRMETKKDKDIKKLQARLCESHADFDRILSEKEKEIEKQAENINFLHKDLHNREDKIIALLKEVAVLDEELTEKIIMVKNLSENKLTLERMICENEILRKEKTILETKLIETKESVKELNNKIQFLDEDLNQKQKAIDDLMKMQTEGNNSITKELEENLASLEEEMQIAYNKEEEKILAQNNSATSELEKPLHPHHCDVCLMSFRLKKTLIKHIRECQKKCSICRKSFSTKWNLDRHITTHTGLYYDCSMCHQTFTDKSNLVRHVRRSHDNWTIKF